MHDGIGKLIGKGIQDYCTSNPIVCIGVTSWGTVKDREDLIVPEVW